VSSLIIVHPAGQAAEQPSFEPLAAPARIADTRSEGVTVDGKSAKTGLVRAQTALELQVAGRAGVDADAEAATLNVTAVGAAGPGFLTVYPCDQKRPLTSNVNYLEGGVTANGVFAGLDAAGKTCIYSWVDVHVVVDVNGFMPAGVFEPLAAPARIADTRPAPDGVTIDKGNSRSGIVAAKTSLEVQVAGRAGIAKSARTAVLNVTVTNPGGPGFVTVYPCGGKPPNASNLNYMPDQVVANAVVAVLNDAGKVCVYTYAAAHVIVDVAGSLAGDAFVGLDSPQRLVDSRAGNQTVDGDAQGFGYRRAGTTLQFPITGRADIPDGVTAVALNVTAVNASDAGFLTIHPRNSPRPNASSVNYMPGEVVANTVIAAVGGGGMACLYSMSNVDVIIDVAGYFVGEAPEDTGKPCPTELPANHDYDGWTSSHPVGKYGLAPGRYVGQVTGVQLCDVHRSDEPEWVTSTLYGTLGKWGPGQFIVDVQPTDGYVSYRFDNCPTLVTYEPPEKHLTTISPGWYTVGPEGEADLTPGRYRATFTDQWNIGSLEAWRCVGRTVTAFDGNRNPSRTIAEVEVFSTESHTVEITLQAGAGFFTEGCTPWQRVG